LRKEAAMEAASVGGLHAKLLGQILQYIIPGELHSILHFRLRSRKRSFNAQVFPCGGAVVGFWQAALKGTLDCRGLCVSADCNIVNCTH